MILMHGYIGVGKTTFAKQLAQTSGAVLFVFDDWMVHFYGRNSSIVQFKEYEVNVRSMIWAMAHDFLSRGHDVILDYGFWSREERDRYRKLANKLGVDCELYQINCPDDIAKARALARTIDQSAKNIFIDENAYEGLKVRFEQLGDDEERIVIDIEATL